MNAKNSSQIDAKTTRGVIDNFWDSEIVPAISRYIEIPNLSPLFDPEWHANGHMMRAVELARDFVVKHLPDARVRIFDDNGRTPLLMIEVDGQNDDTILLYGHLDKQPPLTGWEEGLDPFKPVIRDGKLYGRGGADDGYAVFSIVSAIKAVRAGSASHARLVAIVECCEESGSVDLPYYIEQYSAEIGTPSLIVCLDSGCGNYDQLWMTTSLRGSLVGNLTVEVLSEGVHSGDASGIVPSSFRVLRILLDRLEDADTGALIPKWMYVDIPTHRLEEVKETARILGNDVHAKFPWMPGMKPMGDNPYEMQLNRTWRPTVSYIGQEGLPDLVQGGNVLRMRTSLKLSLRFPPTLDATEAGDKLKSLLESEPPYGAKVTFEAEKGGSGWNAAAMAPWLSASLEHSSREFFGKEPAGFGEGGSIPFMGMLGEKFPKAQFLITGVLGPKSNAHGPNEFLHLQTGKNLSACVAHLIADHFQK